MEKRILNANIAKRALTAIMDLFFAFLFGIAVFSISSVAFTSSQYGGEIASLMTSYQLNSRLYYLNEDGNVAPYDNLARYDLYEEKLSYYYTVFLGNEVPEQYREQHDIYWFNVFILGLDDEKGEFSAAQLEKIEEPAKSQSGIFEYATKDGEKDYDSLGVPHHDLHIDSDISKELTPQGKAATLSFFYDSEKQNAYYNAGRDLYNRPFYSYLVGEYQKLSSFYPVIIAVPPSAIIFYLIVPLIFKNGCTFGKKIMHLAIIREDEYAAKRPQIVLRQLPSILLVTILFVFLDLLIAAIISLGILIVSYVLSIFTPNHRALHDYIAYTRVVDDKESIYFDAPRE